MTPARCEKFARSNWCTTSRPSTRSPRDPGCTPARCSSSRLRAYLADIDGTLIGFRAHSVTDHRESDGGDGAVRGESAESGTQLKPGTAITVTVRALPQGNK